MLRDCLAYADPLATFQMYPDEVHLGYISVVDGTIDFAYGGNGYNSVVIVPYPELLDILSNTEGFAALYPDISDFMSSMFYQSLMSLDFDRYTTTSGTVLHEPHFVNIASPELGLKALILRKI